ncbi:hypothetical protein ASE94_00455 [Devosia sp. Leaf64]|nr:hypothetical protein ASE94_00455 [Devosia sp. Leaf64]
MKGGHLANMVLVDTLELIAAGVRKLRSVLTQLRRRRSGIRSETRCKSEGSATNSSGDIASEIVVLDGMILLPKAKSGGKQRS